MINRENEGAGAEHGNKFLWLTVKSDLEIRIIRGEYAAGERIPTVRKIVELYGVCASTASKTLAQLCQEGTIYCRRGVGYFVQPYVKERLKEEHKRNLEEVIRDMFEYADLIGVDPMPMINKMKQAAGKK